MGLESELRTGLWSGLRTGLGSGLRTGLGSGLRTGLGWEFITEYAFWELIKTNTKISATQISRNVIWILQGLALDIVSCSIYNVHFKPLSQ